MLEILLLDFDEIADLDLVPLTFFEALRLSVKVLTLAVVELAVGLVALVVLISLLQHGEDQNHGKCSDHR